MKYVIMCGGTYKDFEIPKQLSKVKGERLADRTIRLLKENGIKDIYISSNNPLFDSCGVPRLENKENHFTLEKGSSTGYWLDAFYPNFKDDEKVCFLWGDVYFSNEAIKKIVNYNTEENVLFGNSVAMNTLHQNWGEPFAYKVNKYKEFMDGVNAVKRLYDKGLTKRHPIVWELYRYLNHLDINIQAIKYNYVPIDDDTIDIDRPEQIEEMNARK